MERNKKTKQSINNKGFCDSLISSIYYFFSFKGHSRRGNCLLKLKRKKEALVAFCKGHTYASNDREKNFTAKEVISTATELPG